MTQSDIATRRYRGSDLRKGRYSETGRIYLVTTVTRERRPVFSDYRCAISCARELHRSAISGDVDSLAWVVMPDHVHWLFGLRCGELGNVLRGFKTRAAHAVNVAREGSGQVWQRGYHDHAVRHDEDVKALARYVVANPVRAGLWERVGDYPFWDAAWL